MIDAEEISDDEIFFGKMSLKEVRKHIFIEEQQNLKWSFTNHQDECNSSLNLITTHSEPNLLNDNNKILSDTNVKISSLTKHFQDNTNTNESVKDNCSEMHYMLTNICRVTTDSKSRRQENQIETHSHANTNANIDCNNWVRTPSPTSIKLCTLMKKEKACDELDNYLTPNEESKKRNLNMFPTPSNQVKINVLKTPSRTLLPKKAVSSLKKGVYQQFNTPVPTCQISKFHQNCGEGQNFKEINFKKTHSSAIPIFIKAGPSNKENLINMANCSGKKTDKGISKEKMLKNVLVKKSTLPLPKIQTKTSQPNVTID